LMFFPFRIGRVSTVAFCWNCRFFSMMLEPLGMKLWANDLGSDA